MNSHGPDFRSFDLFAGYDIHLEAVLTRLKNREQLRKRAVYSVFNTNLRGIEAQRATKPRIPAGTAAEHTQWRLTRVSSSNDLDVVPW